jgi:type VI secretion system secreted protein Hcp
MASRIFFKIGNIEGSSDDDTHSKWIEIESFDYGVVNSVNAVEKAKGNPGGEACTHANISLRKKVDQTSTQLYAYASAGKVFDEATIECCEEEEPLMKLTLKNCAISSVHMGGDKHSEAPEEQVELAFAHVGWQYKDKQEDYWDLVKNTGSLKKK